MITKLRLNKDSSTLTENTTNFKRINKYLFSDVLKIKKKKNQ